MNTELPHLNQKGAEESLDQRFSNRPQVRHRLLSLADMIDSAVAEGCTAHEAEARAIEQIRQLGNAVLPDWAEKSEQDAVVKAQQNNPKLRPYRRRKLLTWHSTYGDIRLEEQRLRQGRRGAQVRPFCQRAKIKNRAYSLRLQRALTDFGADESFVSATRKMREHYGIELPASGARQQTLTHAQAIGGQEHEAPKQPVKTVVTQMDGCMLPIVETVADPPVDRRKGKQLFWREARLCCARSQDAVDCVYGATFGSVKLAGWLWRQTACAAGLGPETQVHGLGDGARWIVSTFEEQFGSGQDSLATYTVDFHHVSDYLAAAALAVAPERNKDWLRQQQKHLLENQVGQVLSTLEKSLEAPGQTEAPVRSAHGYMSERQQYMDYAGARAAGLPIGSGEVESGHRHVLQKRLKIAGAWWLEPNAEAMLQLRTARANHDWDKYWSQIEKN
jgi:hypothetical protein